MLAKDVRYHYLGEFPILSWLDLSEDSKKDYNENWHKECHYFEPLWRVAYNLSDFMKPGYPGKSEEWFHGIMTESNASAIVIYFVDEQYDNVKVYRVY